MSVWLHLRGYLSKSKSASFKPHVTGNVLHDWYVFYLKFRGAHSRSWSTHTRPILDTVSWLGYRSLNRIDFWWYSEFSWCYMYPCHAILTLVYRVLEQVVWSTVESRLIWPWPQVSFPAIILSFEHINVLLWAHRCIWIHLKSQSCSSLLVYRFFWIRAGMMGWLLINLSVAAKQYIDQGSLSLSMALFQGFCTVWFHCPGSLWSFMLVPNPFKNWSNVFLFWQIYVLDYFWHEEYMTSTWVFHSWILYNVRRDVFSSSELLFWSFRPAIGSLCSCTMVDTAASSDIAWRHSMFLLS